MTTIGVSPRPSLLSRIRLPKAADLIETVPALPATIVMVVTLNGLF